MISQACASVWLASAFAARICKEVNVQKIYPGLQKVSGIQNLYEHSSGLKLRVRNENFILLFLNQNIWRGFSKELSQ